MKHSLTLHGHRTSVSLEPAFWRALQRLSVQRGCSVNEVVARIDAERLRDPTPPGLSSALRLEILAAAFSGELQSE